MLEALLAAAKKSAAPIPSNPKTVLLMHFDGASGATAFTEESGRTIQTVSNSAVNTTPAAFGTGSLAVGTGRLQTPNDTRMALTGDWTVEGWAYRNAALGDTTMLSCKTANDSTHQTTIGQQANTGLGIYLTDGVGWRMLAPAAAWTLNAMNHFAVVKKNGVIYGYVNGKGYPANAVTTALNFGLATGNFTVGGNEYNTASQFPGWMDELRICAEAVYDGDFTPPTAPFTLVEKILDIDCTVGGASASFQDKGRWAHPISYTGSPTMDTTGKGLLLSGNQYLSTPYVAPDFILPGDFTLEAVITPVARISSFPCFFSNYSTWAANGSLALFAGHQSGDSTRYQVALNGSFPAMSSTAQIAYNTPTHIAVRRIGTTISLWVQGILQTSITSSVLIKGTADQINLGISGDTPTTSSFNGYLRKYRLTKGLGLDVTQFLPV